MAVNFPSGFTMSHNEPVDNRLVLTKAAMVSMRETKMPPVYLAVCKDDGLLYLYNSANTKDPNTGKFRVVSSGTISPTEEPIAITID